MKKLALLGLSVLALSVGGLSQLQNVNKDAEARDATIIVKLKGDVRNASYDAILNKQNAVLNEISSTITSNYRVINRYSNALNGFVLEVPSAYVSSIRYLNSVDKVNYNNPIAESSSINDGFTYEIKVNANSTASAKTMEKPEGTNEGHGTFIAILDTGFYITNDEQGKQVYHNVFKPLPAEDAVISQAALKAKIDAAKKFNGKYDNDHSTYYNTKVPFYYDYGGDKANSVNPDFDVYAEGQDHGTHVASIAAGNAGDEYQGVAPKAQLALMKVFTTYMSGQSYQSGAYPAAVLAALEDCLVLGVDSINMSLGSNLNDFDDGEIVEDVIRDLEKAGTFVNVAAGNDGKGQYSNTVYRYWQKDMVESNILSSYANNLAAMTVASAQPDEQFYGEAFTVDGKNIQYHDEVTNYNSTSGKVEYSPERHLMDLYDDTPGAKNEIEFYYTGDDGLGRAEEYNGKTMTGKLAVVNRGDITFREKVENATAAGAVALAIINNTNDTEFNIRMSFAKDSDKTPFTPAIPVIFVLQRDKEAFSNATSNKITLVKNKDLENAYARQISDYSSDGMRYDLSIKPEISTPGENIKGAVLGAVDKYESMSGTSMATPNYAGAVALMISNHLGDANYRKSINARLMSTAQPMKDNTPDQNYTSVRRQGAGLVNLDAAINSPVYLDGIDASGNKLGKAKIELFNNNDIKAGKVKLSFKAINEGEAAISYTAKTYVLAPALDEYSEEIYPEFAGQKFQTTNEQLVEVFTDTVNVPVGETTINLPEHTIAASKLEALDADFESGCILEGFVILEATGQKQLSIPFLGYYGDLAAVSPVEPFDFEREEGKLYNSDIMNYFLTQSIGKSDDYDYTKADYTSRIVAGYWENTSGVSVSNALLYNKSGITRMTDGNGNTVNSLGMNPYTGKFDKDALFMGNNGYSNTMIIQQFVNRSVRTNTLTLTNKANNKVVLTDHMFDNLMGSDKDADGNAIYPLYKSHFDSSLFDRGYMAHRAYSIIPLYSVDETSKKQVNYPDGEYEMKFEYQLSAGSTYTVSYNLTIESNLPVLQKVEAVKVGGQDYYRFYYNDANVAVVKINETNYPLTEGADGKLYADVPAGAFDSSKAVIVNSTDTAFGQQKFFMHVDDPYMVQVYNPIMMSGYDFSYTVAGEGTNDQTFTFEITKNGKTAQLSDNVTYRMLVPEGLDAATLKVATINAKGQEKTLKVTKIGDQIEFSAAIRVIRFTSDFLPGSAVLESISVSGPTKKQYDVGEAFDPAGLVVTAYYSNGATQVIPEGQYTLSEPDMSTAGNKVVTVTYKDKETTFTIKVGKSDDKKAGCFGSVVSCGSLMAMLAAFGVTLISLKRKKAI